MQLPRYQGAPTGTLAPSPPLKTGRFQPKRTFELERQPDYQPTVDITVLLLGFFLIALSSISSQVFISYLHLPIRLIGIAQVGAILGFLMTGRHLDFMKTRFGVAWVALGGWWVLTSVVGLAARVSLVETILPYLLRLHILPFLFVAIACTAARVRMLMYFFAWGYVIVILYCYKFGTFSLEEARFNIPDTTLENPNDLALHLLLGASFIMVFFRGSFTRLVAIVAVPTLAWYVLQTSSRSSMLTLMLVGAVSMAELPTKFRIRMILAAVLGLALVLPVVPRSSWNRLLTFWAVDRESGAKEADDARHAVDSTKARTELQRKGVIISLMNPLFGVGARMFPQAVENMVRDSTGQKSTWQVTHNTYLQVSSESGVPGLILYLFCIVTCFRLNHRCFKESLRNPALQEFSLNTFALLVACVVYAFDILFCSIAYDYHLAVLIGFTAANNRAFEEVVARQMRKAQENRTAAPAPGGKAVKGKFTRMLPGRIRPLGHQA